MTNLEVMQVAGDPAFIKAQFEDHYEVGEELGRGAFSVVIKGTHKATKDEVAVKIINKNKISFNAKQEAIIKNEIAILRKIQTSSCHPNLVAVKGVYEDQNRFYIVLELLRGGELFDRIVSKGSYTEKDAAIVTRKLVNALATLHRCGILHRDVKPENILYTDVSDDSDLKITDFGLALIFHNEAGNRIDVHNCVVGTPGYLPPEALTRKEYGPACDVWSMGVVVYILLCGYPPFYGESNHELYQEIVRGKLVFEEDDWKEISEESKDLIGKMLTKDPKRRITCDEILKHPWIANCEQQSAVPLTDTLERLRKFNARQKFKAAAMACMIGARMNVRKLLKKAVGEEGFNEDELDKLRRTFNQMAPQNGEIDRDQFQSVMEVVGFRNKENAEQLFNLFDDDGNGKINYRELLVGLRTLRSGGERALKFCFDVYDRANSGYILKDDLAEVLATGLERGSGSVEPNDDGVLPNELADLFEELDTDNDGKISFEEFKVGVQKHPFLVSRFLGSIQIPKGESAAIQSALPRATAVLRKREENCLQPRATGRAKKSIQAKG